MLGITDEIVGGKHKNVGDCVIVEQCFRRHMAFLDRCRLFDNSKAKTGRRQQTSNASHLFRGAVTLKRLLFSELGRWQSSLRHFASNKKKNPYD